jgi:hypothetical protein
VQLWWLCLVSRARWTCCACCGVLGWLLAVNTRCVASAVGCWLLAVGCWLLAAHRANRSEEKEKERAQRIQRLGLGRSDKWYENGSGGAGAGGGHWQGQCTLVTGN